MARVTESHREPGAIKSKVWVPHDGPWPQVLVREARTRCIERASDPRAEAVKIAHEPLLKPGSVAMLAPATPSSCQPMDLAGKS